MHGTTGVRAPFDLNATYGFGPDRDFMQAIARARTGDCPPPGGAAGSPFSGGSFSGAPLASSSFTNAFNATNTAGASNPFGGFGGFGATPNPMGGMPAFGPPSGSGSCARSAGSSCGCNGNVSSSAPTASGGAPLSAFDFMSGPANAAFSPAGGGAMQSPWRFGAYSPAVDQIMNRFGAHPGGHNPFFMPQHSFGGASPYHAAHGAAQTGFNGGSYNNFNGLPFDPASMNTMAGMAGHDMPGMASMPAYYSLDGVAMVHAKNELRDGAHLTDPNFFDRMVSGEYGYFSGVALDMDASGDLAGQVYISGHPAAFHQLYDEGREKGLTGEELNQYIAEELTNVNDLDDIDERYYQYWEARGVPRPTRDHDLHNTGSIAVTLAPGQTLSLKGAHQFDTITDPKYNFTDVKTDQRGTFIEFYRMSNNNDPGNGHHEDVVAAARIYLSPAEVRRIAGGTKAIDIVNERFKVDDDTADYRLSPGALNRLAMLGMPVY